eukprot:NODE_28_length_38599_cov_0.791792.p7 type:complete len:398 gc:universal NODE_28_length_38599_cov_0.791792:3966-2773(-)
MFSSSFMTNHSSPNTQIILSLDSDCSTDSINQYIQFKLTNSKSISKYIGQQIPLNLIYPNESNYICKILFLNAHVTRNYQSHLITLESINPNHDYTIYCNALLQHALNHHNDAIQLFQSIIKVDNLYMDPILYDMIQTSHRLLQESQYHFQITQLISGIHIANDSKWNQPITCLINSYAKQMNNLIYIITDLISKQCYLVDPCWDTNTIIQILNKQQLNLIGVILTHFHFDHVGGIPPSPFHYLRVKVPGLHSILKYKQVPVYMHELDVSIMLQQPGNADLQIQAIQNNEILKLGNHQIQILHTPGHTPGSICLLVNQCRLITGDTLFKQSCGTVYEDDRVKRVDEMIASLKMISEMDENIVVLSGHGYRGVVTSIGQEKESGILGDLNYLKHLLLK